MGEPTFDPAGFFDFELASGAVRARGGARVLVLSDTVLAPLVSAAASSGDLTALTRLGKQLGEQVTASLPTPTTASPEAVLAQAAGALAVFGFGRLGFVRWGDALLVSVTGAPTLDAQGAAVGALLGGLLGVLGGQAVACVRVADGKYLAVDPGIAETVKGWVASGADLASVVGRLAPAEKV